MFWLHRCTDNCKLFGKGMLNSTYILKVEIGGNCVLKLIVKSTKSLCCQIILTPKRKVKIWMLIILFMTLLKLPVIFFRSWDTRDLSDINYWEISLKKIFGLDWKVLQNHLFIFLSYSLTVHMRTASYQTTLKITGCC